MHTGGATRAGAGDGRPPAARPERSIRMPDVVYLVMGAAVLLYAARYVLERNWGGDYWEHAAAVTELVHRPWRPLNPYTGAHSPSVLLDTWHLGVAFVARTGLGVEGGLAAVAVAQLVAVLAAIRVFARRFVAWAWAPPVLLVATLLMWGRQPWVWSGYLDLNGLGSVAVYPSTGATAAMLWGTAALDRWVRDGERRQFAVATGCAAAVGGWSPMTLLPFALLAGALLATAAGKHPRRVTLAAGVTAGAAALGLLTTRIPPGSWVATSDALGMPMLRLYADVGPRTLLALPGLAGLALRFRRLGRIDMPAVACIAGILVFVTGDALDVPNLGRALVAVMLCLHLGWVEVVRGAASLAPRWRAAAFGATALFALAGVVGAYAGIARAVPLALLPDRIAHDARQTRPERAILTAVDGHLGPDDVVADLTWMRPAVFVVAGARVLATTEDPLIPDRVERERASGEIGAGGRPASEAIDRFGVTAVWCADCSRVVTLPGARPVVKTAHGTLVRVR